MDNAGMEHFIRERGWTESCLYDDRWNPPRTQSRGARVFTLEEAYQLAKGYKRLAQTKLPGGDIVERAWTPHEMYMLYVRGFREGAATKAMDKNCEGLEAYERGYDDGQRARNQASSDYAKEVGYNPTILRAADSGEYPASRPGPGCSRPFQQPDATPDGQGHSSE